MDFGQQLAIFASTYSEHSLEEFTSNPFANFVRSELAKSALDISGEPFVVKGSVGQGTWSQTPWLGFFHPLETISAQVGFYVVYLVNPSNQTVTLSMNQGVTAAKEEAGSAKKGRELLHVRAGLIAKRAGILSNDFNYDAIDLGDTRGLGRDYEAGHAFGKTYNIAELENGEKAKQDLLYILAVYKNLVTQNGYTVPDDSENVEFAAVVEKKKISLHKRFDRLGGASAKVKNLKGYICEACGFDFEKTYGDLGKKFIEAHHLVPFARLEEDMSRALNLNTDFAVLCSNCHRMIHRQWDPSDIELLKRTIQKN